jgi:hypothetical protein
MNLHRVARALLLVLFTLAVASCGGGDGDQTAKALGAKGEGDLEQTQKVFQAGRGFGSAHAEMRKALQEDDISGSRTAVDAMNESVVGMEKALVDIEGAELADTLEEYVAKLRAATDTYERVVAYLEDGQGGSAEFEDRLLKDALAANRAAQAGDRTLMRKIISALPADQRDEAREQFKDAIKRLEDQAKPD